MENISSAVIIGFVLSIASTFLCLAWGIRNWNKSGAPDEPVAEVVKWAAEEDEENRK